MISCTSSESLNSIRYQYIDEYIIIKINSFSCCNFMGFHTKNQSNDIYYYFTQICLIWWWHGWNIYGEVGGGT